MKTGWFRAAVAAWALLLAASLAPRLRVIVRQAPEIFGSVEARARAESGHPGLYEALARLRGAARGGEAAMLLWHANSAEHQYIFYRSSYELYPLRVWFVPLAEPPVLNEEVSLISDGTGGGQEAGNGAEFAAIGSHEDPGRSAIYRKGNEAGGIITMRRLDPQPVPVPADQAVRPWLWPAGLGTVIALGMFFAWASGLNRMFAGARTAWLGFAFLSGAGLIGFFMLGLSLTGAKLNLFSVGGAIIAAAGVWYWLRRGSAGEAPFVPLAAVEGEEGWFWADRLGVGLIILGAAVALLRALIPFEAWHNWDAWAIWDFKAKACFEAQGIPMGYLRQEAYGFSHRDYPLGLPLLQTYLAFWSGGIGHPLLRLISPCFYLALLFMTADLLRALGLARGRWLLAGFLGLLPFVLDQSANGYADLPLSAAMTGCLAISIRSLRGQAPMWAVGWSGAIAASIKDEGLVWAGACMLVAFWGLRRRMTFRRAIVAGLLFLALVGPWKTVSMRLGLSSTDRVFDMATIVREAGSRAMLIVRGVVLETVGPGMASGRLWGRPGGGFDELKAHIMRKWLLFWQITLIAFVLGLRKLRGDLRFPVFAVLGIQAAAVTAAYLATAHDMGWHLMTSLDRILLQIAPAFLALAASGMPVLTEPENPA